MEKPRVLLADDNEATCTLIVALLRHEFIVEVAADGQQAIEKLKTRHYEAILLDLLMPGVDGYGVLDFLQANMPALVPRVVVVTASVTAPAMQRVSGYPIRRVVAKPFEVDVLQAAVRDCTGPSEPPSPRGPIVSGGMLLLLADLLRRV